MGNAKRVSVMVGFMPIATRIEVATDDPDASSKDIHAVCDDGHDPVRVKQTVGCPVCDTTHSSVYGFRKRGTERDGKMVVLGPDELAEAKGAAINGREVPPEIRFRPREKAYAATVAADSVQYMYPDKGGERGFALLLDALKSRPDLVGVMTWAPSSKNALWFLEPDDNLIVISKRHWPEDVRVKPGVMPLDVADTDRMVFQQFVDLATEDFRVDEFVDEGRKSLADLIAARQETATAAAAAVGLPAAPSVGNDVLMAQLLQGIDALKAQVESTPVKPVKKAATKKAPAKKVAKKAPAKKTAKKSPSSRVA